MRNVSPEKQQAIFSAADALVAEGADEPTNDQVRAKMGGGSIADISPAMRKWRESRKHMAVVKLAMPESVTIAGDRFITQLWAAADAEAGKAIDILNAECATRVQTIEAERDEALAEISRVEDETTQLRNQLEKLKSEFSAQVASVETLTKDNQKLAVDREKARARADAALESQTQAMAQLKDAQANNKALQKELVKLARSASAKK